MATVCIIDDITVIIRKFKMIIWNYQPDKGFRDLWIWFIGLSDSLSFLGESAY